MSPLHSQKSPTPSGGSKITSGPQQRGTKSKVAASTLPSRGPNRGRNCYVTLHSRVSKTLSTRRKIRSVTNKEKYQSEVATSPPPSLGPKRGQKWYITSAVSGMPNKGEPNHKGLPHTSLLRAQRRAELPCQPCILGIPQQRGTKTLLVASPLRYRGPQRGRKCRATHAVIGILNKVKQNLRWLPQPRLLGRAKKGGNSTAPLHSRKPLAKANKIKSACHTPALSRARKRAEMRRHPCILENAKCQAWGAISEVLPNKGEQNQKCLLHPCLLGGPKEGGNATSPLHSRGSPTQGSKIRRAYLTLRLSRSPSRGSYMVQSNPTDQQRGS